MIPKEDFKGFGKIPRLFREMCLTEKIDGSNAQIFIDDAGQIFVGSRTRWITPEADNFGFARWVEENKEQLLTLGPGQHFGEWWGSGINRGYGLAEKRFSLFNVGRWHKSGCQPVVWPTNDPRITKTTEPAPGCCSVVPILYIGQFQTEAVKLVMDTLRDGGSRAQPGFTNPEGVVVLHRVSGHLFKVTLEKDGQWKGA